MKQFNYDYEFIAELERFLYCTGFAFIAIGAAILIYKTF
jgi:hypothetical protein